MEKPDLKCEQCTKSFNRPAKLHAHVKVKHQNLRYPCAKCYRTYASWLKNANMKLHVVESRQPSKTMNAQYVRSAVPQIMNLRRRQQYHHFPSTRLPNRPMISSKEAPASKKPRQNTDNSAVQRLNFRRCHEKFENKRDLYLHGMRTHYQIGQGVHLQPSPYG